jgi:hypothetical protein
LAIPKAVEDVDAHDPEEDDDVDDEQNSEEVQPKRKIQKQNIRDAISEAKKALASTDGGGC